MHAAFFQPDIFASALTSIFISSMSFVISPSLIVDPTACFPSPPQTPAAETATLQPCNDRTWGVNTSVKVCADKKNYMTFQLESTDAQARGGRCFPLAGNQSLSYWLMVKPLLVYTTFLIRWNKCSRNKQHEGAQVCGTQPAITITVQTQ